LRGEGGVVEQAPPPAPTHDERTPVRDAEEPRAGIPRHWCGEGTEWGL
jgi:hypothetical protein